MQGYLGFTHPSLRPPYKSYEYESIDDGKRADWDPSQSYLASSYAVAGGALRETAINSVLDNSHFSDHTRYACYLFSYQVEAACWFLSLEFDFKIPLLDQPQINSISVGKAR